jgi:glycosyltransferase involved in cell wall biosynthesis
MRLLVLTPTPVTAASTRFRLVQFFPALREAGIVPELRSFLDEAGFSLLYAAGGLGRKATAVLRAIAGRIADLVRSSRADAVLIHREAALLGPPLLEWLIAVGMHKPMVFDLDDAVWVPYVSPTYGRVLSRLLKAPSKAYFTMSAARQVIAGNEHIASEARRHNASVAVIPTVVDTEQFRPAARDNPIPVIGWIGTHSTAQYLNTVLPALRRVAATRRFVLRVVGAHIDAPDLPVDQRQWSLDREVEDFQSLDIGLYPLVEDSWSVGKSGFKAIQYMACGVPVVASPVGVTRDMVRDGKNGYLATSEDAWVERLTALIDAPSLRESLGRQGRADVEQNWSLAVQAPRFVSLIEHCVDRVGSGC